MELASNKSLGEDKLNEKSANEKKSKERICLKTLKNK